MSRTITNWAKINAYRASILSQIENAPTEEALVGIMKHAVKTKASADTKRKWAAACEKRIFVAKLKPHTPDVVA